VNGPTRIIPPRLPIAARPVRLPARLLVHDDESARVLSALRHGRWVGEGRYAKVDGGAYTYLGDLALDNDSIAPIVLKQFPPRAGLLGRLRSFLPESRALKQIRGAALLRRGGEDFGKPVCFARAAAPDGRVHWLALRRVPGEDCIHALARVGERSVYDQHFIAEQLGLLVRNLRAAGLFNRDLKLSNIVLRPDKQLAMIDTVGVRRASRSERLRRRMLRAMLFEAAGTGLLPRRTLLMRCLLVAHDCPALPSARAHRAWRRLAAELSKAGDTTPRVSPLPRA